MLPALGLEVGPGRARARRGGTRGGRWVVPPQRTTPARAPAFTARKSPARFSRAARGPTAGSRDPPPRPARGLPFPSGFWPARGGDQGARQRGAAALPAPGLEAGPGRARVWRSRRPASKSGPVEPALVVAVARRLAAVVAPAGPGATRIAAGLQGFRAGRLEPRSSAGLLPCVRAPPRPSPPPLLPVHRSCGSSRWKGFQAREPAPPPRPSGALSLAARRTPRSVRLERSLGLYKSQPPPLSKLAQRRRCRP